MKEAAKKRDLHDKVDKVPNHQQLVNAARKWLQNSARCSVIACELTTTIFETPDAIGWTGTGESTLVECKTSRSDFFADRKKWHRNHDDA